MAVSTQLLVDPAVSRLKFDREIATYHALEDQHIRHGRWLVRAVFPQVSVVFSSPRLKPPAVLFGALIDYTNYDLWPPSVRLVHPFTQEPYKMKELPVPFLRRSSPDAPGDIMAYHVMNPQRLQAQLLFAAADADEVPFLCLPGVREYHAHPAHTGDSWFLHRGGAEGTLNWLLHQLWVYGVQPIDSYSVQITNLQIVIAGFGQAQVPA